MASLKAILRYDRWRDDQRHQKWPVTPKWLSAILNVGSILEFIGRNKKRYANMHEYYRNLISRG